MKKLLLIVATVLSLQAGIVVKESECDVYTTAHNLQKILKSKGIKIFAKINHAANAKSINMALQPSIAIVFGKPKMGTLLMQEDPSIGLDLPLKVLIFQDKNGHTKMAYKDGNYFAKHYNIKKHRKLLHKITNLLQNITNKAGQCKKD